MNRLQFLHPQLRPRSQPQSCLDTRGALEEGLALDEFLGRNRRCGCRGLCLEAAQHCPLATALASALPFRSNSRGR